MSSNAIDPRASILALYAAGVFGPVTSDAAKPGPAEKARDAMLSKLAAANAVAAFKDTADVIQDALTSNPETLALNNGAGSALVFGSRSFGLPAVTLADGRKARWNVQIVLETK